MEFNYNNNNIPFDIWEYIFDRLEFIDKLHFKLIGTWFYENFHIKDLYDIDAQYLVKLNDDILKNFKYTQALDTTWTPRITNDGIKDLHNLRKLNASSYSAITNVKIKHLWLNSLLAYANKNITNGIKGMPLKFLLAEVCDGITDASIKEMTTLKKLFASYNDNITNDALKKLDLDELTAYFNPNITIEGVEHMRNLKIFRI